MRGLIPRTALPLEARTVPPKQISHRLQHIIQMGKIQYLWCHRSAQPGVALYNTWRCPAHSNLPFSYPPYYIAITISIQIHLLWYHLSLPPYHVQSRQDSSCTFHVRAHICLHVVFALLTHSKLLWSMK
jgi:hypothetical protein